MKSKSSLLTIVITVVLVIMIVLNVIDLIGVLTNPSEYPFGSDFFSKNSIYQSKQLFVSYQIGFTLILLVTMWLMIKRKWSLFAVFFLLDMLLFFYPIVTNT